MPRREILSLKIQYVLGYLAAPLLAPLYLLFLTLMGYRIRKLSQIRQTCRNLFAAHPGSWLICANHLTMIDSLLLTHALFSLPEHLTHYRRLPWNLPERDNFQVNPILTLLCYLAKCLPINRGGDRAKIKKVMQKCDYLLDTGQCLMIFPEGGRSRTGRVDQVNYAYGVGRLIADHPTTSVLCVYLRGEHQDNYSNLPRRGEKFYVKAERLDLKNEGCSGLRLQRALASQVIEKLAVMEKEYFDGLRK